MPSEAAKKARTWEMNRLCRQIQDCVSRRRSSNPGLSAHLVRGQLLVPVDLIPREIHLFRRPLQRETRVCQTLAPPLSRERGAKAREGYRRMRTPLSCTLA